MPPREDRGKLTHKLEASNYFYWPAGRIERPSSTTNILPYRRAVVNRKIVKNLLHFVNNLFIKL